MYSRGAVMARVEALGDAAAAAAEGRGGARSLTRLVELWDYEGGMGAEVRRLWVRFQARLVLPAAHMCCVSSMLHRLMLACAVQERRKIRGALLREVGRMYRQSRAAQGAGRSPGWEDAFAQVGFPLAMRHAVQPFAPTSCPTVQSLSEPCMPTRLSPASPALPTPPLPRTGDDGAAADHRGAVGPVGAVPGGAGRAAPQHGGHRGAPHQLVVGSGSRRQRRAGRRGVGGEGAGRARLLRETEEDAERQLALRMEREGAMADMRCVCE